MTRLLDEDEIRGSWSYEITGSLATILGVLLGTARVPVSDLPELEQVTDQVCPRGDSNTRHAV